MRAALMAFLVVLSPFPALAQQAVEPEQCIIDTLKGAPAKDAAAMVRWNCIRRYIRAVEPMTKAIDLPDPVPAEMSFYPAVQAFPTPIAQHIVIRFKNDSPYRVVSALISLTDRKTLSVMRYKIYADYPIDPASIGTFTTDVMTSDAGGPVNSAAEFDLKYMWNFVGVFGLPPVQ